MAAVTKLLTAEDLYSLPTDLPCELVDGVLIEMSPSNALHGWLGMNLGAPLSVHVAQRRLGFVVGEVGFILRRGPDTVRECDLAFVRLDQALGGVPPEAFWEIAPDLVVEIVSPSESRAEIQAKVRDWMEAGVHLLLYVYPHTQTIEIILLLQERETLGVDETLDLDEVVPGFSCPVAVVFGK